MCLVKIYNKDGHLTNQPHQCTKETSLQTFFHRHMQHMHNIILMISSILCPLQWACCYTGNTGSYAKIKMEFKLFSISNSVCFKFVILFTPFGHWPFKIFSFNNFYYEIAKFATRCIHLSYVLYSTHSHIHIVMHFFA